MAHQYTLTLGTLWKNEESYALDFLKYHRHVGVEKFIILDREYHPLKELLKNEPDVEIIHFPESPTTLHADAWAYLVQYNKGKTKWLALIDADQALVPVKTTDVKEVLIEFERYASVSANWKTIGSGGQEKRLPGSVYERFTMRCKDSEGVNNHCQVIVQPDRGMPKQTKGHDPHSTILPYNEISVNTNHQAVHGPWNIPPVHDKLFIAHYINKSREEFIIKNAKGRADVWGGKIDFSQFDGHEAICNVEKEERMLELWNLNKNE